MSSTTIYRTQGTPTNAKKFTFSTWVKRCGLLAAAQRFYQCKQDDNNRLYIKFNADTTIWIYGETASSATMNWTSTKKFRDPSAWYHIVLKGDSTQAAEADRFRVYINGIEETAWTKTATIGQDVDFGNCLASETDGIIISGNEDDNERFDGEMSHVQFVDGSALAPTEFGEFDSTSGIWKIKTSCYATPGANGFCLKMEDRTNLDLDSSSNAHTFTTGGNLTATYDNPSNNFATMNPLNVPVTPKPVFTSGNNTVVTQSASGKYFGGTSSLGMVGGKWYCEFKAYSLATDGMVGINGTSGAQARNNGQVSYSTSGFGYVASDGKKSTNLTDTAYGNSWTTANVIGVAVDLDNLKIYFAKDNVWQDSGDPTSGATGTGAAFTILAPSLTPEGFYAFSCADKSTGSSTLIVNFGNGYFGTTAVTSAEADGAGIGAFEFAPPTGYYALCTKNIKAYGG